MKFHIEVPAPVQFIIQELEKRGYEAYMVGGCVRDNILGRTPHDYDICTSATPDEIIKTFPYEHIIPTGLRHGTVTILINNIPYEVTTYRIDGEYSDSRRPNSVEFTDSLIEDLKRRDFTINAMAYNPRTGVIDPFDGIRDIKDRTIRCVGNPHDRFSEDALRILRLWRFCIQLRFHSEVSTSNAAYLLKDNLKNISYERIQMELIKALMGNKTEFVAQPDWYLEIIFPEWKSMKFKQNNPYHCFDVNFHSKVAYMNLNDDADLITRISTLLHDIGKPHSYQDGDDGIRHFKGHGRVSANMTNDIMKRLRFDNDTRKKVVELVSYHDAFFEVGVKYVRRWLNKIGEMQFRRLIELRKADIKAQNPIYIEKRLEKIADIESILENVLIGCQCFTIRDLVIDGNDVMQVMRIEEGKKVGYWLKEILNRVIDGRLRNDKDELVYWMTGIADGWIEN